MVEVAVRRQVSQCRKHVELPRADDKLPPRAGAAAQVHPVGAEVWKGRGGEERGAVKKSCMHAIMHAVLVPWLGRCRERHSLPVVGGALGARSRPQHYPQRYTRGVECSAVRALSYLEVTLLGVTTF